MSYLAAADPADGIALSICHASHAGQVFYPSADTTIDPCGVPTVDTEDGPEGQPVEVYPNPFTDQLRLTDVQQEDRVQLFTATGQPVGQWKGATELWLDDLPAGLYVLTIERDGRLLHRNRLIKL
jgi:hypothetical protein